MRDDHASLLLPSVVAGDVDTAIGAKTAKLIHGTVKIVKGRRSVAILNEALIPKDFLREKVTYAPDKKAIMAAMDDDGEVIEGTEIVQGEDTVSIKTLEDAETQ